MTVLLDLRQRVGRRNAEAEREGREDRDGEHRRRRETHQVPRPKPERSEGHRVRGRQRHFRRVRGGELWRLHGHEAREGDQGGHQGARLQREAVVGLLHQRREARAREEGREAHGRPRGRPPPRRHVRHRRRGRRVRAQGEPAGDVAQDRRRRDRGETLVMIPIRDGRRLVIYGSGYLWTIGSINNPADGGRRRAPRGESKRTSRVTRAREQPPREVTRALMRRRPIDYAARAGSTSGRARRS
mmetsp:Transcript_9119/g.33314  ORF Transcript_9119/g.33314 Transcript_9119/m.33314 type:complete len:243 (-) Transcript_9119:40-768(-)